LLGESPVWDAQNDRLLWVDIDVGDVHSYERGSGRRNRWHVGAPLGSVRLADDGRLVLGLRGAVYLADESAQTTQLIADVDRDELEHRLNDSACDAAGRMWTGTMRLDATGYEGALYRLDWNGGAPAVRRMLDGVGISNGIGWSLDQTRMYFIDTPTHRVDVIDFDLTSGDLGKRRPLVDMEPARPDGMAVDAEGWLWVAVPSHGQVRRYSPAGKLDGVIDFPARRVTSCCFGGAELDELYVTSARDLHAPGTAASGGAVYRCRPGVQGQPANRFRNRP
jgi:sugar lactone lactonase YvrE